MKKLRDLTRDVLERIARQAAAGIWLADDGTLDVDRQVGGANYLAEMLETLEEVGFAPQDDDGVDAGEILQTTAESEVRRQSP